MKKVSRGVSVLFALALLVGSFGAVFAAGPDGLVTAYPLPGSPYRVAVEGTARVWVTLPARNTIGRLVVDPSGASDFREFPLPTPDSHPYDIVYAAGSIWVSEHAGNKIARFDPLALTWTEYSIPTMASQPTGLTVLPGNPIQVWFCERAGNKLGLLTITAAGSSQFTEFPLPQAWAGAALENIAATSSENVWFTAPGRSGIITFVRSLWPDASRAFTLVPTGTGTKPHDIKIGGNNLPWFTEPGTNRIGYFNPETTTTFEWYPVFTPNSGLAGMDLALGYTWFTQQLGGRMGQLQESRLRGQDTRAAAARRNSSAHRYRGGRGWLCLGFGQRHRRTHELVPPVFPSALFATDSKEVVMRRDVRSSVWWHRLVPGLIVVILLLVDLGAPLIDPPSAYAADRRGESGQSTAPDPASTSSHKVYLPLVVRQPSQTNNVFGVQIYDGLNSSAAALDLTQTAGVSWVRWPLIWESIEPNDTTPGHYNWATTDASFAAAKATGLKVVATLMNNPSWAATTLGGPLDRSGVGALVEFMAAAVERYDGDGRDDAPGSPVVDYWELYNEPDGGDPVRARTAGIGYWGPFGADYAQMLCAVYPAAKAASPNAKMVLGGMAYDWFIEDGGHFVRAFLDNVLAADGGRCLDAVAFHYYPLFEPTWAPYGPGLSGKANYLRSKLDSYGLSQRAPVGDGNRTSQYCRAQLAEHARDPGGLRHQAVHPGHSLQYRDHDLVYLDRYARLLCRHRSVGFEPTA